MSTSQSDAATAGQPDCPAELRGRDFALAAGLMLGLLLLYQINGGFLPGNDAAANLYLPVELIHQGSLSFRPDSMPQMFIWRIESGGEQRRLSVRDWHGQPDEATRRWLAEARSEGIPADATWGDLRRAGRIEMDRPEYYLVPSVDPEQKGYVNQFGPGAGLTALPVLGLLDLLVGDLRRHPAALWYGGKWVASLCVAASAAIVFLALVPLTGRRAALIIAALYGAGTCVWSVASQTLWQSGPNLFFLALGGLCLLRIGRRAWWAAGCGAALGWAVVCRPTSAVVVMAVGAYLAAWTIHRIRVGCFTGGPVAAAAPLLAFVAAGLPFAIALAAYNTYYLGSPLSFGQTIAGAQIAAEKLGAPNPWGGSFWEGFYGMLISPSRGLLVYSPVLIFAGWGIVHMWREPRMERLRPLGVAAVLMLLIQSKWYSWHGGWSFGYRLMVDAMPLAALSAAAVVERVRTSRAWLGAAAALAVWSIGVQVIGAFAYDVVGWNHREAFLVRHPDGRAMVTLERAQAEQIAGPFDGRVRSVRLDVDRPAFRGRLWSLGDNPLAYYVNHFAQSRRNKQWMIQAVIHPPSGQLGPAYEEPEQKAAADPGARPSPDAATPETAGEK